MPMQWRKSPEALVNRFAELVPDDPGVERRQMFGYPAAFVGGHLFMSLYQDSLVLRLSQPDRAALLKRKDASLFEPMPGRPMREYVVVPRSMVDRGAQIAGWIGRSLNYAASIPPKTRRVSPSRKRAGSVQTRRPSKPRK